MRSVRFIPWLAASAAALLLMPTPARADGFLSPNVGVNFGGEAGRRLADAFKDGSKVTYGVAAGWMGAGIIGLEEDVAFTPNFYGNDPATVSSNRVLTLMTNLIVGVPVGGQAGAGVRPYVSGGIGIISRRIETIGDITNFHESEAGYDLGGGVMGYFSDHAGLRVDLRYFRNFRSSDNANEGLFGVEPGTFNFGKATIGFLLRF